MARIINRALSDANYERAKSELAFLVEHLGRSRFRGELAIEFRGPSELGIYDRGLRLAQLRLCRDGGYRVTTHRSFIRGCALEHDPRFPNVADPDKSYATFAATQESIRALLQTGYLAAMRSRIKGIPHREELGVAHVIAADNMAGTDVVVVDREVGDSAPEHPGERLDLLALQQVGAKEYRFLAIEVKLGNNAELDTITCRRNGVRSAVQQVEGYAQHIEHYFEDYAQCYRRNVAQKLGLKLLSGWHEVPAIVRGTRAMLVVAGYGGIAAPHLEVISREHEHLWVKTFGYALESRDGAIAGLRASSPERSS